ncbi:hypothetical protein QQ054_02015 [Oscillatoria amoena NRMC-F 0135]|nr:hypothetical protein [Geitlerinema splendidum]MDL5044821.1 hypothetical protein [Oscillatoria amoena NRMC-F 0135]
MILTIILDIIQDYKFILGLLLSLPLAIVANLLTPRIEAYWAKNNRRARQKQLEKIKQEYERLKIFNEHRYLLTEYLLLTIAKTLALGAIVIFWNQMLTPLSAIIGGILRILILISSLFIAMINLEAIETYQKIKDFTNYEKTTKDLLINLDNGNKRNNTI